MVSGPRREPLPPAMIITSVSFMVANPSAVLRRIVARPVRPRAPRPPQPAPAPVRPWPPRTARSCGTEAQAHVAVRPAKTPAACLFEVVRSRSPSKTRAQASGGVPGEAGGAGAPAVPGAPGAPVPDVLVPAAPVPDAPVLDAGG